MLFVAARPSLKICIVRYNSTEVFQHSRIATEYAGVVIPSAEEIRKLHSVQVPEHPTYKADTKYLKDAPHRGLAARLMCGSLPNTNLQARHDTPQEEKAPIDVEAITQRRREARLAREAQKINAYNMAKTATIIKNFSQPHASSQEATTRIHTPTPEDQSLISESAKRRREQRLRRDTETLSLAFESANRRREQRLLREREREVRPASREDREKRRFSRNDDEDFTDLSLSDDDDEPGSLPQFSGPEEIINLKEIFSHSLKPTRLAFAGNYSQFVQLPSSAYSTPPAYLGPVKNAQVHLSHRQDYSIQQRKRVVDLVETLDLKYS